MKPEISEILTGLHDDGPLGATVQATAVTVPPLPHATEFLVWWPRQRSRPMPICLFTPLPSLLLLLLLLGRTGTAVAEVGG